MTWIKMDKDTPENYKDGAASRTGSSSSEIISDEGILPDEINEETANDNTHSAAVEGRSAVNLILRVKAERPQKASEGLHSYRCRNDDDATEYESEYKRELKNPSQSELYLHIRGRNRADQ